jgi:hypothetical protein
LKNHTDAEITSRVKQANAFNFIEGESEQMENPAGERINQGTTSALPLPELYLKKSKYLDS